MIDKWATPLMNQSQFKETELTIKTLLLQDGTYTQKLISPINETGQRRNLHEMLEEISNTEKQAGKYKTKIFMTLKNYLTSINVTYRTHGFLSSSVTGSSIRCTFFYRYEWKQLNYLIHRRRDFLLLF